MAEVRTDRRAGSQGLYGAVTAILMLGVLGGCFGPEPETPPLKVAGVTKWYEGRSFAISINLDGGALDFRTENDWLIEQGLFLDYEIVSLAYDEQPVARSYLLDTLTTHGFGYFGHGHGHVNHDALGYDGALASFSLNHARMLAYGATPVSYAYPEGMGRQAATQKAVREAGFYAARSFQEDPDGHGPYIMSGNARTPRNWYLLPTLRMEDSAATGCYDGCTNNSVEFFAHLEKAEQREAWVISTYHGIGYDGQTDGRPVGWGFYKRQNFYTDMLRVRELRDAGRLWLARMDDVVRYVRQRDAAEVSLRTIEPDVHELTVNHPLDSSIFNHPMTIRLELGPQYWGKALRVTHPDYAEVPAGLMTPDGLLVNVSPSARPYRLEVL